MNYPTCPNNTSELCRFVHQSGSMTEMYSPVVYDRYGAAVAGGGNIVEKSVECIACRKNWISRAEELEDLQGIDRVWEER